MALNINSNELDIARKISDLKSCEGICIFIDICDSTKIKIKDNKSWIIFLSKTITFCINQLSLPEKYLIKIIGDELMFFIPSDFKLIIKDKFLYLESILNKLKLIVIDKFGDNFFKDLTLETKAAIHYCKEVYNITFHEGFNDYYGKDIDLTARLMKKTAQKRLIISDEFYNLIKNSKQNFIKNIKGPFYEDFKGFDSFSIFWILE